MTITETITVAEDGIITLHAPDVKAGDTVTVTATSVKPVMTAKELADAMMNKKRFEDLTEAELDAAYKDFADAGNAAAAMLEGADLPPDYSQTVKKLGRVE